MPRPKKPVDYNSELEKIEAQITRHKHTIAELEAARKELIKQKELQELSQIQKALEHAGMTPAAFLESVLQTQQAPKP